MNFHLLFFMWICINSSNAERDKDLDDFLDDTFLQFYREANEQQRHLSKRDTVKIKFEDVGDITGLNNSIHYNTLISGYNSNTYLLSGKQIHKLDSNKSLSMELLGYLNEVDEEIRFAKTINFAKSTFILTRLQNGVGHIFILSEKLKFMHSLRMPFSKDATFFTFKGNLYLTIINNKGENLAEISVYRWTETFFDEIQVIFTTGAFKVKSFSTGKTEIIVVLRKLPSKEVYSNVYEFDGKLRKVHSFPTKHPIGVDTYTKKGERFIIVYEESKNNIIYHWNGLYFVRSSEFITTNKIQISTIIQTEHQPYLIAPREDKFEVYQISSKVVNLFSQKLYNIHFATILGIENYEWNEKLVVATIGRDINETLHINFVTMRVEADITDNDELDGMDRIHSCYKDLESKVYYMKKLLSESDRIPSAILIGQSLVQENNVTAKIEELENRISTANETLTVHESEGDTLIINGNVRFEGMVEATKVTGLDVSMRKINGMKWRPEQYLRYKEPQTITGPSTIVNLFANDLRIPASAELLKDAFLRTSNPVFKLPANITKLTANSIMADKINDLDMKRVYLRGNSSVIEGVKTFHDIITSSAHIESVNQNATEDILSKLSGTDSSKMTSFDNNVFVENLFVETINDVDWGKLTESVYWKSRNDTIKGSLKFSKLHIENITLNTLNGIDVNDYLTRTTDQTISSSIAFNRIYGENMNSDTVNGIVLEDSAIPFGSNVTINGPVNLEKLTVVKDLHLIGDLDESFFTKNGDHIMGTNESDLFQRYKGIVKIKGDLYVNNIQLSKGAKLIVSDNEIQPDIAKSYWTKNTNQAIKVNVLMQHGLSTPLIMTENLNGVKFDRYMLNNNANKHETDYFFEHIIVMGNVMLNSNSHHNPDLKNLTQVAVMTNGTYLINGKKTYLNYLKAENLAASELDGIKTMDVLNTKWSTNITGEKIFKTLTVKGNITSDVASIQSINDVDIEHFLNNVVYIDEPQNISINFKSVSASDFHVDKINGISFSTYLENVEKMKTTKKIEDLFIIGNITIDELRNVSNINNVPVEVLKKGPPEVIHGDVRFTGKVKIDNLRMNYINGINLRKITKRFLCKEKDQTITAPFTFKNIIANNIQTSMIKNISFDNIVDVSSEELQHIHVPQGVKFNQMHIFGSLNADSILPCQVDELPKAINDLSKTTWSKVLIKGDVTVLDEMSPLYRIANKLVLRNSSNTISAPVRFSKNMLVNNISTHNLINGVNITDIVEDAVLQSSDEEQVIKGQKWFPSLRAREAIVKRNSDIPKVNGEIIKQLDEQIVVENEMKKYVIKGDKTFFGGLECNRFYGKLMDGNELDKIVLLGSDQVIPDAIFDSLVVDNDLNIGKVNDIDLEVFMNSRLLVNAPKQTTNAVYFFNDIEINDIITPTINDVALSDVVFDGDVNITSPKIFTQNLTIHGNISLETLDGINITAQYKKSLLSQNNTHLNANVTLLRPTQFDGFMKAKSINSFPISRIEEIINMSDTREVGARISNEEEQLATKLRRNLEIAKALPKNFFYLEKSNILQISLDNVITASTMVMKDYVLIHMIGIESGEFCDLPQHCICPTQFTMEISPELSVNAIINKGHQRVFSYNDGSMIAHFITNSVTTNSTCRNHKTKVMNEISILNWNTLPSAEKTIGQFHKFDQTISGYISKVEYFTVKSGTYAVVARYYDSVLDTYDLECLVIKFSQNKTRAEVIQSIQTRAASEIHLFATYQGTVLIIGSVKLSTNTNDDTEETFIHRFDEDNEQFMFLRSVPYYGCMSARGVAIGLDSLIVLVHRFARPIIVLKYYPEFDNYFYYQVLDEIEDPVVAISTFYGGDSSSDDVYLNIVTKYDMFYIYKYMEGWKQELHGTIEGLRDLIPFYLNGQQYLFAPSANVSSLLTIVTSGNL